MRPITQRKWFYPLIYVALVIIAFLPLYTQVAYSSRDTQQVIFLILQAASQRGAEWGWVFHVATLAVIALTLWKPQVGSRAVAAYFGVNYLVIAALQTWAVTEPYGLAVHTGALVADVLLGVVWLVVAARGQLALSFRRVAAWKWALLPLAVLTFWSPIAVAGARVVFDFDPLLLLTSPGYGLAYCFLTPVLLFLLIVAFPNVSGFAYRVTAFNGLIYGLFNLSYWFNPDTLALGVMHVPLLVLSIVALFVPRLARQR